jgi:hypothetical protein
MSAKKGILFLVVLMLAGIGISDAATISISTDKGAYDSSEAIHVKVGAANGGSQVTVDLYYVLLNPEGKLLFFPTWTEQVDKIQQVVLTPNFNLPETEVFTYNLPSYYPPIIMSGNYTVAIGIANEGTMDFLSIDSTQFSYTAGATNNIGRIMTSIFRDYSSTPTEEMVVLDFMGFEYSPGSSTGDQIPLEGCVFDSTSYDINNPPDDTGAVIKGLDAGEKILVTGSPNGNINLLRTSLVYIPGYSYDPERDLESSDFAYNTTYHFIGTGGPDVIAFNESVTSLPDFQIQSPKLQEGLVIDRSKALNLTWTNPLGSPYELQTLIMSTSIDIETMQYQATTCTCRFTDDGSATIPQEYLKDLINPGVIMGNATVTFSKVKIDNTNIGDVSVIKESSINEECDITFK